MEQQQQRNQHESLEHPKLADGDEDYVAPRTTGEWIWDNNPHEDRSEEWKKK